MSVAAGVAAATGGLELGAGLLKTWANQRSADSQVESLRLEAQQEQLAAATASNQRLTQVQKIISAQNANIGASGLAPSSASFSAIQTDTLNQASQDQKTADLNAMMKQTAINQEISNTQEQAKYSLWGNLFDTGIELFKDAGGTGIGNGINS